MRFSTAALLGLLSVSTVVAVTFEQPVSWKPGLNPGTRIGTANGKVVALEARGSTVRTAYDGSGRRIAQQLANGDIVKFEYNANGRLQRVFEPGYEKRIFYRDRSVAGEARGRTAAELAEAETKLDATNVSSADVTYDGDGRVSKTSLLSVTLAYRYDGESLTQTLAGSNWTFQFTRRPAPEGGVEFTDSLNNQFTYFRTPHSTLVRSGDAFVAACELDGAGRMSRLTFGPGVAVAYEYDANGAWTRKVIAHASVIERKDYPDPEPALGPGGTRRTSAADLTAQLLGRQLTFEVRSPVAPVVGEDGRLLYYLIKFESFTAFADDELRLFPDGSATFLPACPHGEYSMVSRSVYPRKISVPSIWKPGSLAPR